MDKKIVLVFLGAFIIGAVAGFFGVSVVHRQPLAEGRRMAAKEYREALGLRTVQAYLKGEPAVGIWALETWIDLLRKEQALSPDEDNPVLPVDIVMAYGRLALLYQRQGNTGQYQEQIAKALAVAQDADLSGFANEKDVLDFVKGIDARFESPASPAGGSVARPRPVS